MSPRQRPPRWLGVIALVAGAWIVALAGDLVPHDPASLHAPRWVLGAAGLTLLLTGAAVLMQASGIATADPRYAGLVAVLITVFAAPFNWVAFGPGERHFSGGLSLLGLSLFADASGETMGRVVFGFGAIVGDVIAVLAWRDAVRRWRDRGSTA